MPPRTRGSVSLSLLSSVAFKYFAQVESVFGVILLIRLAFRVIWCLGLLLRVILPVRFELRRYTEVFAVPGVDQGKARAAMQGGALQVQPGGLHS